MSEEGSVSQPVYNLRGTFRSGGNLTPLQTKRAPASNGRSPFVVSGVPKLHKYAMRQFLDAIANQPFLPQDDRSTGSDFDLDGFVDSLTEGYEFDHEGWSDDVDPEFEQAVKPARLPATPENIARARDFVLEKWQERGRERGYEVSDLTNSCKFSSLFAREIFGGKLRGSQAHQFVELPSGKILDLNIDAKDVRALGDNAHDHDDDYFWGNPEHKEAVDSCRPRVAQWVAAFLGEDLTEGYGEWDEPSPILINPKRREIAALIRKSGLVRASIIHTEGRDVLGAADGWSVTHACIAREIDYEALEMTKWEPYIFSYPAAKVLEEHDWGFGCFYTTSDGFGIMGPSKLHPMVSKMFPNAVNHGDWSQIDAELYRDQLTEAMNTPQPYTWSHAPASKGMLEIDWARFGIGKDKRGQVDFFKRKDGSVYVSFSVGGSETITGDGDAFTVFATVLAIIHDYVDSRPDLKVLIFDSTVQEPSRLKLYRAMVRSLIKGEWETSERSIENGQTQQFVLTRD
jgi:hypothetical protein